MTIKEGCARLAAAIALLLFATAATAQNKPNILIIWGDDIGQFNVSAYNMGMMGYRTPNIDRIAAEGAVFTDWYGQRRQSFRTIRGIWSSPTGRNSASDSAREA